MPLFIVLILISSPLGIQPTDQRAKGGDQHPRPSAPAGGGGEGGPVRDRGRRVRHAGGICRLPTRRSRAEGQQFFSKPIGSRGKGKIFYIGGEGWV